MGKAARNKKNSKSKKNANRPALEGLTAEESRKIRALRKGIWLATTPCERLRHLMGAHPEEISDEFQERILELFHDGSLDYDSAVGSAICEIATPLLEPYFVLCEERRLLSEDDPGDFIDAYLSPVPSDDPDAADAPGYLLVLAHTFFSENAFLNYKASILHTLKQLMRRATTVQALLDSGEVTWEEVHGSECQQHHGSAVKAAA
ncbi:hypothetical protein GCM10017576_23330 [Microbacterium barkeri]|uniref:Uncharacterized protein n=1 Tax=Microbacterium barkeri TaxID=33917 RepID=A0A9W6LXF9_9MICO|nr:hypothetical protein [Microbacterium barkeri]MDI6944190.1 hypothetical protein [Microbacterium barkeri]MDR6876762.1 hypothetical protein [Microbacterium barkeri]GLJ62203.1 hypothetical protein GCM10017576_23330 [Microbacterium barkeri]